jgi:hypothetical protein
VLKLDRRSLETSGVICLGNRLVKALVIASIVVGVRSAWAEAGAFDPKAVCGRIASQSEETFRGVRIDTASCLKGLRAIEEKLSRHDVAGAALEIAELDANNALFPSYQGDCENPLTGGICSVDDWRALKMREVFSNTEALRKRMADFAPVIEAFAAERNRRLASLRQDLEDSITGKDLEGALKHFAALKSIGGLTDSLLESLQALEVSQTLEKDRQRAEQKGPKHANGNVRWYPGRVYNHRLRRSEITCETTFGPGTRAARPVMKEPLCWLNKARALREEEVAGLTAAADDYDRLPPSRRPKLEVHLIGHMKADSCPDGMNGAVRLNLDFHGDPQPKELVARLAADKGALRTYCRAPLPEKKLCPDGYVAGDDEHAICIIKKCPPGSRPMSEVRSDLEGCYACPLGAIDPAETLASPNPRTEILCRVGPQSGAPTAKAPKPKRR